MKKSSLIFIVFCCGLAFWQTNLSPRNIAIIGVNGDPPDEFLFVLLNNENLNAQICHPPDLTTPAELQQFPWYGDENDTSILDKKYDSLINLYGGSTSNPKLRNQSQSSALLSILPLKILRNFILYRANAAAATPNKRALQYMIP